MSRTQIIMNIKYPIKKKTVEKQFVPSNLGMTLEKDLEETNLYYLNNNIAVIYKKISYFSHNIFISLYPY